MWKQTRSAGPNLGLVNTQQSWTGRGTSRGDKEQPQKLDENQEGLISWKQGQERFKNETMTNYAKCHCQEDQEAATGLAWVIDDSDKAQGTEPVQLC